MYQYDSVFYDYISKGAIASAEVVLPLVGRHLPVASVVDFGCGQGAWLSVWRQLGAERVCGVDGDYVSSDALLIPADEFEPRDLSRPIDLGRRFDLVQCLEVAEHLPAAVADTLIGTLVAHGDLVLFSAAPPGQGGEHHINEQPYEYWRDRFSRHGYVLIDWLRPRLVSQHVVEPWYRYNIFLYVNAARLRSLPPELADCRVPDGVPIPDISPPLYRLRKAILRLLTPRAYTWLAILKKRFVVATRAAR